MPDNPAPPAPPVVPPTISPATPPPAGPPPNENQARTWNMWCHLSALSALAVPFGNVLGPLLVWQIKKNEIPSVEIHGKAALNFQLTVLIATLGGFMVSFILMFVCIGYFLFFVVMAIPICGIVFAIIAGIKANDGKEYTYPYSFNLIK